MTTDDLGRATVRYVGGFYIAYVLLQRFAVPGMPVAVLLPFAIAASGWGVLRGVLEFHQARLVAWLVTAGVTALLIPVQSFVLERTFVSVSSWGLFMMVWLPFTLRLVDRRLSTYVATLRVVVKVSAWIAAGCLVMLLTQYAGLPYQDWLANIVPGSFLLNDFVITYPISYGSEIYRANAWIGLEPSIISFQLGIGLVAALLVGSRTRIVALLVAGLVAATSGSGFAIAVVALAVLIVSSARSQLRKYAMPALVAIVIGLASPMGQSIAGRLGGGSKDPSLSLRAIYPYIYLWPTWVTDMSKVLFGDGPGSSQKLVEQSGVTGLLVPTPVKIFYEYGLLAGAVLAAMMLFCFMEAPSRAMAATLLVSLWVLQPGTTTSAVVLPALVLVSWWAPRTTQKPLEDLFPRRRPTYSSLDTPSYAGVPTRPKATA